MLSCIIFFNDVMMKYVMIVGGDRMMFVMLDH